MSDDPGPQGAGSVPPTGWAVPRILVFYRDVIEAGGTVVAHYPIRWGVRLPDGRVAAWPLEPPYGFTVYDDIDTAEFSVGAWVDTIDSRQVGWRDSEPVLKSDVGGTPGTASTGEGEEQSG